MTRLQRSALLAGALCLPAAVLAQATSSSSPSSHPAHAGAGAAVVLQAKDLKWGEGPPGLPPGGQAVLLEGDPSKPGPFTLRAKLPAGYRIAPHHHPADERVTVLSGAARIGMGEKFDEAKMTTLPAGGYFSMPKGHRHYFLAAEDTVIQLNGMGPWNIVYVNPADDPRLQKGAAKKGSAP
jgi:quercetin dioxygenase-like cupin family protein